MLERIIAASIRLRWIVLALVAFTAVIGVWSFQRLPIDARPDITRPRMVIPDTAHMCHFEQPEVWAQHIRTFLDD